MSASRPTFTDRLPYLSIVVTGRNDDFGGDFNGRFFRAIRFNHRSLIAASVDYEVVFVEWRPLPNRPLLAELLREHVPELAGRLTTYVVDARYHEAFSQNPRLAYHEFVAKNVGVRRALGSYILTTNTDVYLSRDVVSMIARQMLRPMMLYRATRIDLKSWLDPTNLEEDVLADPRNHAAINSLSHPFLTNAAGDFLLLDRFSFHALRGFNEVFRAAKIHIDANFCYHAKANGILLVDTGACVYHFGEGTFQRGRALYGARPAEAPWGNRWAKQVGYENPCNWGLGDAPVVARGSDLWLEFDPGAVPPLVSLQRIMPPAAARSFRQIATGGGASTRSSSE